VPHDARARSDALAEQQEPRDYAAAFYGFMKKKKREM
jgi:hypothetical protein